MRKKIPFRNRSPYGWWVASYIARAQWDNTKKIAKNGRCLAWEHTIIIKAPNRERAYAKAMTRAKQSCTKFWDSNDSSRKGRWVLEGLTHLLPIYEKLGDGAEILWNEYENTTVSRVRKLTRKKRELECFDDRPDFRS